MCIKILRKANNMWFPQNCLTMTIPFKETSCSIIVCQSSLQHVGFCSKVLTRLLAPVGSTLCAVNLSNFRF